MTTLKQRLARVVPFFRDNSRAALGLAAAGMVVAAATEPVIPFILKRLLDSGFKQTSGLPIWSVPLAIVVLFMIRGISWWVSAYGLTKAAQNAVLAVRTHMFNHMMRAAPALFTRNSASSITNNIVYEVQQGANLLMGSVQILIRDSLTALFFMVSLIVLNWRLTLFVLVLFPITGYLVRIVSKRLHRLNVAGQDATDELAYVVEENVLAWRIVRLHGAAEQERRRFAASSRRMRSLTIKQQAAGSLMSPVTQVLASFALAAVLWMALAESTKAHG
ncbi:MAG: lipid ABC transporter permease/ATP-binding protein, partial [Burkholderiales bacterium]|nr:lipid ABC transporter permease/ATP-binding protein [Burkholderiales bacterium]